VVEIVRVGRQSVRIAAMLPTLNFRFSVPILVLIAILAIAAVAIHTRANAVNRETINFAASLAGGMAAIYALLLSVQTSRSSAARKLIERWNNPSFAEYRLEAGEAVQAGSLDKRNLEKIRRVLNFFEELAISVHRREAEEAILQDFFQTTVDRFFRVTEAWIMDRRKTHNQPTGYIHPVREPLQALGTTLIGTSVRVSY